MPNRPGYIKRLTVGLKGERLQPRTQGAMRVVIQQMAAGETIKRATEQAGVSDATYQTWRRRYPIFKEISDELRNINTVANDEARQSRQAAQWGIYRERKAQGDIEGAIEAAPITITPAVGPVLDIERSMPEVPELGKFRFDVLGRPTPQHQEVFEEAVSDHTNLVVLLFAPPSAGKDTFAGDFLLRELCRDRALRSAWFMRSDTFSVRRLRRLKRYFTDHAMYRSAPLKTPGGQVPVIDMIDAWGPFTWEPGMVYPNGTPVPRTTWNNNEVYFVGTDSSEADPNLWATGVDGAVYGSRIDLAVLSDPFDRQNQLSPVTRENQYGFVTDTLESRLDEMGRLLVLGTLLPIPDNNYERIIETYTMGARVIGTGPYHEKFSNGTMVVRVPAIQHDTDGLERSYWPIRFPLDPQYVKRGRPREEMFPVPTDLDEQREQEAVGAVIRIRGLREIREREPSRFAASYQQKPSFDVLDTDFTQALLDSCDDDTRSLGHIRPGEVTSLGVDPARTYGAAWVVWAVDPRHRIATVADFGWHERLGVTGIKDRLIIEPAVQYRPRWLVYEGNVEASIIHDPAILDVAQGLGMEIMDVRTHKDRLDPIIGPASLAMFMRSGQIRFPAATSADRERLKQLKDQFRAWDIAPASQRTIPGKGSHRPDDLTHAAHHGFKPVRPFIETLEYDEQPRYAMPVPARVMQRWREAQERRRVSKAQKYQERHVGVSDVLTVMSGDR